MAGSATSTASEPACSVGERPALNEADYGGRNANCDRNQIGLEMGGAVESL